MGRIAAVFLLCFVNMASAQAPKIAMEEFMVSAVDPGIRLYVPTAEDGSTWKQHATVDDNTMSCEDFKVADLNGDGNPDIIAAGRATKNLVVYWNERT